MGKRRSKQGGPVPRGTCATGTMTNRECLLYLRRTYSRVHNMHISAALYTNSHTPRAATTKNKENNKTATPNASTCTSSNGSHHHVPAPTTPTTMSYHACHAIYRSTDQQVVGIEMDKDRTSRAPVKKRTSRGETLGRQKRRRE